MIGSYATYFEYLKRQALQISLAVYDPKNYELPISCSRYGRAILMRECKRFLSDSEIDFELSIITEDEHIIEKIAYELLYRSIEKANIIGR